MGTGWKQGLFTPKHPEKYKGDLNNIQFRSSWELEAFEFCDNNPKVKVWSSEEIVIPYAMPMANGGVRKARYFPDLYMEYENVHGKIVRDLIEIKPFKQTKVSRSRNPKTKMYENAVHMKNQLKWEAARAWCSQNGMNFRLLTEKEQFK
jgi:hypothetical protein